MTETEENSARTDRKRAKKGQTLAEYALILMLIALACFGAVTLLGGSVRSPFETFNGSF